METERPETVVEAMRGRWNDPEWQRDPVGWIRCYTSVCSRSAYGDLTPDQIALLESVRDFRYTHCRSGNGLGKTDALAYLVVWWGHVYPECKIITTASAMRQVEGQLWGYIPRVWSSLPAGVRRGRMMNTPRWVITETPGGAAQSVAEGFTTDDASKFGGHHHEHLLLILDEGSGITKPIIDAAFGCMQSPGSRFVICGNPLVRAGEFWQLYRGAVA